MLSKKSVKIPSITKKEQASWQTQIKEAVSDLGELYRRLGLPLSDDHHTPSTFPLRVPHAFIAKMKQGDPNDPLLRQVLPSVAETIAVAGFTTDPLDEHHHNPIKGLLHKYQSRVLITVTGACAVHCRYCFRQHFDYGANLPNSDEMAQIGAYIDDDERICEALLSGGDPLNLNNRRLLAWFTMLNERPHLRTIRLHTRLPVVLPDRVDDGLLDILANSPKKVVMVLHINHPNEIDGLLSDKCAKLKDAGVVLLNQSVLLKGINDDADTLCTLSHRLFEIGVMPYYLHILDKVAGSAHFEVSKEQAVKIYWQLLERLSGYLVPKLVQELAGKPYKTPVNLYLS